MSRIGGVTCRRSGGFFRGLAGPCAFSGDFAGLSVFHRRSRCARGRCWWLRRLTNGETAGLACHINIVRAGAIQFLCAHATQLYSKNRLVQHKMKKAQVALAHQAAGQSRPSVRSDRGLRRRLDRRAALGTGAAHRGSARRTHGCHGKRTCDRLFRSSRSLTLIGRRGTDRPWLAAQRMANCYCLGNSGRY